MEASCQAQKRQRVLPSNAPQGLTATRYAFCAYDLLDLASTLIGFPTNERPFASFFKVPGRCKILEHQHVACLLACSCRPCVRHQHTPQSCPMAPTGMTA